MTKQEFLDGLRASLTGRIGATAVESHIRYYEEYINAQVRQGRAESEVLQELGNPRLIARSIIDADKNAERTSYSDGEETVNDRQTHYSGGSNGTLHIKKMPAWLVALLAVLIVAGVLVLLVMVVWWLAPVILAVWLAVYIVRKMRGK